jgi:hypothetical protein
VRQLLVEAQFQVTIRAIVEVPLQIPEVMVDVRVRTGTEQHELGVVAQGVKNGVMDQMDAFLTIEPAHIGDDRFELLAQP